MNLSEIKYPNWRHIQLIFKHTFIIVEHFSFIKHKESFLPNKFIIWTLLLNYARECPFFVLIFTSQYFIFFILLIHFFHCKKLRLFQIWWRSIDYQCLFLFWNLNTDLVILKMHFLFLIRIFLLLFRILKIKIIRWFPEFIWIILFLK